MQAWERSGLGKHSRWDDIAADVEIVAAEALIAIIHDMADVEMYLLRLASIDVWFAGAKH